jgi:hypothetical protein
VADLLKKRVLRSALALAAAGSLAGSVLVAQGASAQTTTLSPITLTTAFSGPVASGVSGVLATVACRPVAGVVGDQVQSAQFGTSGGTTALSFPLLAVGTTSAPAGSNCDLTVVPTGTANLTTASVAIVIGGTTYRCGPQTAPTKSLTCDTVATSTTTSTAPFSRWIATAVPIDRATTVTITLTFPSITVTKVVNGDEPVTGFAYPMTITCSEPGSDAVTVTNPIPSGYAANQLVVPGGPTAFLTVGVTKYTDHQDVSVATIGASAQQALITEANKFPGVFIAGLAFTSTPAVAAAAIPPLSASVSCGFNGTFTLTATAPGNTRTFGNNEFPNLKSTSRCEVRETNSQGSALGYSSTTPATVVNGVSVPGSTLPGVLVGTNFMSALTQANGQTITVTNTFSGDLYISKVVTGDPKTNIGIYEISVACDKGGPKETFSLKDRQTKVYSNIASGTNCLVTETRSDGATASYTDNSGDNTTDGRVTIRQRTSGAAIPQLNGGALAIDPNTVASVIVTNSYIPATTVATTAAPTTAAATTAAPTTVAPATTAAPAVAAAPAAEVESEPTFTG